MKNLTCFFTIFLILGVICIVSHPNLAFDGNPHDYDILIKNGMVFDGSKKPALRADVAVKNGKIVQVARSIKGAATKTINAKGLHITSGFIDLHSHADMEMYLTGNTACLNNMTQGITTIVTG